MAEFKLGITIPLRDLTPYKTQTIPNKPIIIPKQPQQNLFFTPIEDYREQVLEKMKKDLDYQIDLTKKTLPRRY